MPAIVDVLGIGENSIDFVYRLPEFPQPHGATSKLPITRESMVPGGQVATTLCTCAAFGLSTRYIGTFGNDAPGARIRREMDARGIDTAHAIVREAPNRHAVILLDERSGERVVLWHRDATLALDAHDLDPDTIRATRLLHVDDVDEDVAIQTARLAREAGVVVTSDIERAGTRTSALIEAVSVAICVEHVPSALTGEADPERALRALRQRHDSMLCVTRGARGAMLLDGDRLYTAEAFEVDVVDSTGAGDVFRGAFIHALLRGDPPEDRLRFANASAAVSCTREGAIGGVPSLDEVTRILREGRTRPL